MQRAEKYLQIKKAAKGKMQLVGKEEQGLLFQTRKVVKKRNTAVKLLRKENSMLAKVSADFNTAAQKRKLVANNKRNSLQLLRNELSCFEKGKSS